MKPSRISETLSKVLKTNWPLFIWGPPGVGKSSVVRQIAEELKIDLLDVRASLLDPTDLRGIPSIQDGRARWCPPSFLPHDPKSKGLLFFDELNAAPPLVQASLYQLTLDRRVGEYALPDGWRILAAGNRAEDRSITFRMPAALSNRFTHIDFEVDFDDWRRWAVGHAVHPLVLAFLSMRRELLFQMNGDERAFPTPRTWEMASDLIRQMGTVKDAADLLPGVVGEGAAIEILAYAENAVTEEQVKTILQSPSTAELPDDLGALYALTSYITSRAAETEVRSAAAVLLGRLPVEMAVLLLRNILVTEPRFMTSQKVRAFVADHQGLIL